MTANLLTSDEVAEILRCSRKHVLRERRAGRITATPIAGRWLFTPDEVADYMARNRRAADTGTTDDTR